MHIARRFLSQIDSIRSLATSIAAMVDFFLSLIYLECTCMVMSSIAQLVALLRS
jgi:hypothetical protein